MSGYVGKHDLGRKGTSPEGYKGKHVRKEE